jgi:hypothetical protein
MKYHKALQDIAKDFVIHGFSSLVYPGAAAPSSDRAAIQFSRRRQFIPAAPEGSAASRSCFIRAEKRTRY